jgi:hypothetical protein
LQPLLVFQTVCFGANGLPATSYPLAILAARLVGAERRGVDLQANSRRITDDDVRSLKKRPCFQPRGYFQHWLDSGFPVEARDPLQVAHVTTNLRNQTPNVKAESVHAPSPSTLPIPFGL